ncbi:MAG TPA: ABC transporter permease [Vicinamibacterales bacterium]|nr:ABC transporter permease [Vicinamibacterales bacterium]
MTARAAAWVLASALALMAASGRLVDSPPPERQHPDYVYAPPMPLRVRDDGGWRAPFVYPVRLVDRLERRYVVDRATPVDVRWFAKGTLLSLASGDGAPWFVLGTDTLGRDVFARLLRGARFSLGVAALAAATALLIGTAAGAAAGFVRGPLDAILMRTADFILALPAIYVVLTLRAALPLVLTSGQVFWVMVLVFAGAGWPLVARGVRGVVLTEAAREYAESARAIGASRTRILLRHLLPATRGLLLTHATLLVPAFILAEATLSFAGLGFGEPVPSWGLMLQDASRGRALVEAPWLLTPALAIATVVLLLNVAGRTRRTPDRPWLSRS